MVISRCFFPVLFFFSNARAQVQAGHRDIIFNNPSISWAAEYESFVDLTPKTNTVSLKKWFINSLKNGPVGSYQVSKDGQISKSKPVHLPDLSSKDWKDYYIKPSSSVKSWQFVNRKTSVSLRVQPTYVTDSCCGCDDSDAFRVRQLVSYARSRFTITNILLSPLCARKQGDEIVWYAPGNFSYNTKPSRPAGASYITTREVTYNVNMRDSVMDFEVLTVGDKTIIDLMVEDLMSGKLIALDPDTKKPVAKDSLLTWRMPSDTVAEFNYDGETTGYRVIQREFDPIELTNIRITQDWFFDMRSQKLYSEARSVVLMKKTITPSGIYIGLQSIFLIQFPKTK